MYMVLVLLALIPPKTVPVERLKTAASRFVSAGDCAIHFQACGRGEPLLLIHGFGCSSYAWRFLTPLLQSTYRMYALDLPGFGLSDKPHQGPYDYAGQALRVLDFCDALDISGAAVIGHSMGTVVAAQAATMQPQRFHKLVLIASVLCGPERPAAFKHLGFPFNRLFARLFYTAFFQKKILHYAYHQRPDLAAAAAAAHADCGRTPRAHTALAAMISGPALDMDRSLPEKISVPALIVWGSNDRLVPPRHASELQRRIRGSRLDWIAGCGHMVPEEQPAVLADMIKTFLRE